VNRDLVRAMKYASHKSVAGMMGNVIARLLPRPDADFLTPVPLHKNSEREYNQTELIALGISEVWGMPVKDCLVWRMDRGRQASSDREDRELPQGAMEAFGDVRQGKLFLVDDVCTTGNTLMAAESALRSAGAVVAGAVVWGRRL
jgi:predicted amidophosphoribosyltransferase